jgi:hypothetical protein
VSLVRLVITAVAALMLVPAALAVTRPHVGLVHRAPATVAGAGFRPGEHVRVHVSNGTLILSKRVLTNAAGAFTVHFIKSMPMPPCGQLAISAVGTLGDRAAWKSPPPVCGAQPPSLY